MGTGPRARPRRQPKLRRETTMTGTRNLATGVFAAVLTLVVADARAQQISDARIRELIKEATQQAARTPIVDGQPPTAGASRPLVHLTLEDAVKFALDRNLDI